MQNEIRDLNTLLTGERFEDVVQSSAMRDIQIGGYDNKLEILLGVGRPPESIEADENTFMFVAEIIDDDCDDYGVISGSLVRLGMGTPVEWALVYQRINSDLPELVDSSRLLNLTGDIAKAIERNFLSAEPQTLAVGYSHIFLGASSENIKEARRMFTAWGCERRGEDGLLYQLPPLGVTDQTRPMVTH